MQINQPQLREIESPALVTFLLLENPWILAGLLAVAAGATFIALNNRRRARAGAIVGTTLAILALGVFTLATLVTTDREQVRTLSRQLIDAVAEADPAPVNRILSDIGTLAAVGALRHELSRDELLDLVRDAVRNDGEYNAGGVRVAVNSHRIREIRVGLQSDVIARSQINVVITPSITNVPTGTWWEIDWDKHPDGTWRARRIELVWVAGLRRIGPR